MRLIRIEATNFGSYKRISFDYTNIGLALIYGPTGSGKSTLADLAPWALFGVTAKDGGVDEIRSWTSPDEPTTAVLEVDHCGANITVTRIRGTQKQNDLYWTEDADGEKHRGKDLTDTQKLLQIRLDVTAERYLTAAYFHEFSKTGAFFTAKAKERREVFEQIADLSFPAKLADVTTVGKKDAKKAVNAADSKLAASQALEAHVSRAHTQAQELSKSWVRKNKQDIEAASAKVKQYEERQTERREAFAGRQAKLLEKLMVREQELKAQLDTYAGSSYEVHKVSLGRELEILKNTRCDKCNSIVGHEDADRIREALNTLKQEQSEYRVTAAKYKEVQTAISDLKARENPFEDNSAAEAAQAHLISLRATKNPYTDTILDLEEQTHVITKDLEAAKAEQVDAKQLYAGFSVLSDMAPRLRAALLTRVMSQIQDNTNNYLTKFFDAELTVTFTLSGDSIEVAVNKSGYDCCYTQLSKGQRGLLKLCFAVSVMQETANASGTYFDNIFLDEALDGLDESLKVKAIGLLEHLAQDRQSVLVVDHSTELRELFNTRFKVTLDEDCSEIEDVA